MAIEAIVGNEHFHAALVKLAGPFWGKPRVAALLRAMIRRVQELEDATWEVLAAYNIDTADATRLDILGRVVGQPRFAFDDEEFRSVIRAKIAANKSRTLVDDIINVIHLATAGTQEVHVSHFSPATCVVELSAEITAAQHTALEYLLPKTRAAGVQLHLVRVLSADTFIIATPATLLTGSQVGSTIDLTGYHVLASTQRL